MNPSERNSTAELLDEKTTVAPAIDDYDEPRTEALIEMLRESLEDVKAGRTRPARDFLRELRENLAKDDDAGRDIKGF